MTVDSSTLDRLFTGIDEHKRLRAVGEDGAARDLERQLDLDIRALGAMSASRAAQRRSMPPRQVQVAMATALFAAPHLGRTLSWASSPGQLPGFQPSPALAEALGLTLKELEELRDGADTCVAEILRQARALRWMWNRAGDPGAQPRPLFEQLFPPDGSKPPVRFLRRGTRLYASFHDKNPLPPESLYLRWLPARKGSSMWPDDTFQARYVDDMVVRAVIRAVGVPHATARDMLDNLVCVVPASDEARFLRRDRWRSEGWSDITGLARANDTPTWLTLPMREDALDDEPLLERTDHGIAARHARRIFDRHATTRITAAVHGLYGEICARQLAGELVDPASLIRVLDVGTCIEAALAPLLDWPTQPAVHAHWAAALKVPVSSVATAMAQLHDVWTRAATSSWGGAPTAARPVTVQTVLASHLAATLHSLGRAWKEVGDPKMPHQPIVLLFFASYVKQMPLGRLWRGPDGGVPEPEDVIGKWFGVLWRRVLDAYGMEDGDG